MSSTFSGVTRQSDPVLQEAIGVSTVPKAFELGPNGGDIDLLSAEDRRRLDFLIESDPTALRRGAGVRLERAQKKAIDGGEIEIGGLTILL